MRQSFDRKYIIQDSELWIYMIGGGAMALTGIKEATKDVDIIVLSSEDARFQKTSNLHRV